MWWGSDHVVGWWVWNMYKIIFEIWHFWPTSSKVTERKNGDHFFTLTSPQNGGIDGRVREGIPYHFFCFFIKFLKGEGGGSFPFIKIHDANFVYSGGLWQHEICIEKVFWGISKMNFSASSQWSKICFGYQGIIFNGKKVVKVFSKNSHRNFIKRGGGAKGRLKTL